MIVVDVKIHFFFQGKTKGRTECSDNECERLPKMNKIKFLLAP